MKKNFFQIGLFCLFFFFLFEKQNVLAVENGLYFDGIDDYVDVGDIDIQNALTVEAWVKPTNLTPNKILGKHSDETNVQGSLGIWTNGKYSFEITVGGVYYLLQSKTIATLHQYTYLAGVYDGTQISFYVNGVLQETRAATGTIANQNLQMAIGRLHGNTTRNSFNGNIYEIRLWKKAKTQQELLDKMNQLLTGGETGLVANWVLTPQTNGKVYDRSPNRYTGTVYGKEDDVNLRVLSKNAKHIQLEWNDKKGKEYVLKRNGTVIYTGSSLTYDDTSITNGQTYTYEVIGKTDEGETFKSTLTTSARPMLFLDLSGGKRYVKLPTSPLNVTMTATVEVCFSIDGSNGELYQMLVDRYGLGAQGYGYALFVENNTGYLHARFGDAWAQSIPVVLNDGKVHCVGMTHSSTNGLNVYVDGNLALTKAASTVSATKDTPVYLGRRMVGTDGYQLNGKLYDVRIWNIEHVPTEIISLNTQPLTGSEPGLLAYYKMNGIFQNKLLDSTSQANHGDVFGFSYNHQKISIGITAGDIIPSFPQITSPFSSLTLNGKVQKLYASYSTFSINDTTGTGNGWSLSVSATPFQEKGGLGLTLPSGSLVLNAPSVITPGSGNNSLLPTVDRTGPWAIDSGNVFTILKAYTREGMGEFIVTLPVNALELSLFPSTTKVDKTTYPSSPTPYESVVTWTLIAGP